MVTGTQRSYCITGEVPRNSSGDDAHDGQRVPVDADGLAHDGRIGVEIAPPEAGADHGHGICAQRVAGLGPREDAAQHGPDPHHFEVVAGDQFTPGEPRRLPVAQGEGDLTVYRDAGEAPGAVAVIAIVAARRCRCPRWERPP